MKSRSFLYRYLNSLFLVMVVFLASFAIAWSLGVNRGLELWKQTQGQSIQDFVSTELVNIYQFADFRDGESVEEFLSPFLDPSLYLLVFNEGRDLIFWYWKGESWYLEDSRPEQELEEMASAALMEALQDNNLFSRADPESLHLDPMLFETLSEEDQLVSVAVDGRTVAWFSSGSNGFAITRENKQLVDSMILAILSGLGAAIVTGSAFALLQVRRVGRSAVSVAEALQRLAEGDKTQTLVDSPISELQSVLRNASVLQRRLSEEEELRRRWALDIAHDLRTPLSGLRVQIEGLIDGVIEPSPERLRRILSEVDSVEELSNGFLLLTKVESPELQIEKTACTVADFGRAVRDRFADRLAGQNREFTVETDPGNLVCDQKLFARAVSNLIDNSIRHGTGPVRVAISPLEILVSNDGHIPEEDAVRVFERSFQGNQQRSGSGHGLGLSISRAIVEKHGGTIAISNEDGRVFARIRIAGGDSA